jgi:hypothetical protein
MLAKYSVFQKNLLILIKYDPMNMNRFPHVLVLIFFSAGLLVLAIWSFLTIDSFPGHRQLNSWLVDRLVVIKPLPYDFIYSKPHLKRVIYVLDGTPGDLRWRFKTAASLYQNNVSRRIFILKDPGITEYDPQLGRNLRIDEWAIKKLGEFGVKKEDIEPLFLECGFFGTLREARTVSQEASSRGYDGLVLVSSPYHTKRVYESFSKYLAGKGVNIFVYASEDQTNLIGLVKEYFKLVFYQMVLLLKVS